MKIKNVRRIQCLRIVGDILCLNVGFIVSYWVRFNLGIFKVIYGVPNIKQYFRVLPILTLILLFIMRSYKLYSFKSRLSIIDEFFVIIKSVSVAIFLFMAGTFLYREFLFSRSMLLISWVVLVIFLSVWRFVVNRVLISMRNKGGGTRNLIIAGDGPMVTRLINHISDDPHWDYRVKGVLSVNKDESEVKSTVPVLGNIRELGKILDRHEIDEIIMTEANIPRNEIIEVILECEKRMVEFRLVSDLLGMVTSEVDMRTIDGVPLLGLKESPLADGYNRFLKRAMDIGFSVLALVLLFPLFVIIATLIKLTSAGGVFYLQKRIGEDGRPFAIIKFRTMINNAEKGTGRVWAAENDPRCTKVGAFLRKTNLDELPQVINVLKGEMSLVGPRPERPHFVGKFKEDVPRYMARHKIKSGITGWAQVNGLRGNTSIEERTKYDLYYIENWSVTFDLKILLMSFFAMKNAY